MARVAGPGREGRDLVEPETAVGQHDGWMCPLLVREFRRPVARCGGAPVHGVGEDGEERDRLAHAPSEAVDGHRQGVEGRGRPGGRVTGDPDVEHVGRVTGFVGPAHGHRSPPLGGIGGPEAHEVEPGVDPVLRLEMGVAHAGGPAGCAPETERYRSHHAGAVGQLDIDLERLGGTIADPPCGRRTHQGIDIGFDGLDGQVLQRARRQRSPLPLDRSPPVGGHTAHPGLEQPGGHLPAHQSHQSPPGGATRALPRPRADVPRDADRRRRRRGSGRTGAAGPTRRRLHRPVRVVPTGRVTGCRAGSRRARAPSRLLVSKPHGARGRGRPPRSNVGRTTDGDGRSRVCSASSGRRSGSTSEVTASKSSATTTGRGTS